MRSVVDDVKDTRHTRSAHFWGSCSTCPPALVVPRWKGKQSGRTPRSRLVTALHQRAFSSFLEAGDFLERPLVLGDCVDTKLHVRSSSTPLRRGHVGRYLWTEG